MGTACSRDDSPTSTKPSTVRAISGYAHEERLRKSGRRKLVHRTTKAYSYPGRQDTYTNSMNTIAHIADECKPIEHHRRSGKSGDDDHGHSRSDKPDDVCCSKCTKAGMEWDKYKPSAVVKDYAAVSTQNSKFRKHMEDECVAIPKFRAFHGDPAKSCFFGVYDGHGGAFCSKYAAKNFHTRLSSVIANRVTTKRRESLSSLTDSGSTEFSDVDTETLSAEDIENCYVDAFAAIDKELASFDESSDCGSTAVTCLIRKYNGRTTFYVANVGDSRAILYSNGKTARLSVDHKATNEDEVKRIRARNGIIFNKRVGGVISITRALGQTDEKEFITADPHMESGEIQSNDAFLVLASDGVTDVFTDEDITQFVAERLRRGEKSITICKSLLDEAKAQGAMDNMTAVLVCFSDAVESDAK